MNRAERAHQLAEFARWTKGVRAAAETRRLSGPELVLFRTDPPQPESFGDKVRRMHQLNADGICDECERRTP